MSCSRILIRVLMLFIEFSRDQTTIPSFSIRRPEGCTLIPWRAGRCLAWDVTVPGTLAERYVNLTKKECGLAAARAADEKMKKYGNALPSMEFLPVCIEVLGPMDPNTLKFLKAICKMISVRSGDSMELFFATNHISCLLQQFLRASIPVLKEPSGISALDGKRPDGCTLIPWRAGRCLAWDVTVPGTLAERYVHLTSKESGLAATRASDEKFKKYEGALPSMDFLPVCIEVLGPMDNNTSIFFKKICKMISGRSGDSRELFFAMNHISCLLQRYLRTLNILNYKITNPLKNPNYIKDVNASVLFQHSYIKLLLYKI
ncbi:hypothetical protein HELRODRAFT_172717 [Helobdella robusta]|uniref:Uncharacterized protein n=1 Tax=Helobdella robusta TaxID=6412 RepID=T1F5U5_HELRO|nr:hypothetical protein HELRODRAFT_172717 [Helobdella robusta]ESO04350.1 hypothetical protein HELRODRAFT_172717 [Helobdella robusta]